MADRATELRYAPVNTVGAGPTTVVSAEAGMRVCVVGFVLSASAVVLVTWQDNTSSLCDCHLGQNVPFPVPCASGGWFMTEADEPLVLSQIGAGNVGGAVVYRMVPEHQRY